MHTAAVPDSAAVYHYDAHRTSDYAEIMDNVPSPGYAKPSTSSSVSKAASDYTELYSDRTTTLVDNALYDVQQPAMTSSNHADDVTDFRWFENDLYRR